MIMNMGMLFNLMTLKGSKVIAQGNALGRGIEEYLTP